MKFKSIIQFGVVGAMLLTMSAAAMATTYEYSGIGDEVSSGSAAFTGSDLFQYNTVGLQIDNGASATVNGSTFSYNSGSAISNNGTVTITGANFNFNSGNVINSSGTTTINSAAYTYSSGNLIYVTGGTTTVYGATFANTNSGLEFNAAGGVIDLYGNFGVLNGTSITGSHTGSFTGTLQNDGSAYSFAYQTGSGGVINFLPLLGTATPEPSSVSIFAIAGITLVGLAAMRRRVRA